MLHFRSFLNKLPDKGAKIKEHLQKLKDEQNRRETVPNSESEDSLRTHISTPQSDQVSCKRLEEALESLKVHDETPVIENQTSLKHYYEIAVERAEHNVKSGRKEPFKLNRYLQLHQFLFSFFFFLNALYTKCRDYDKQRCVLFIPMKNKNCP